MKQLLFAFMLLTTLKSNGQDTTRKSEIISINGRYWNYDTNPIYDTVKVMFQYSDANCVGQCPVNSRVGYVIKKYDPIIYLNSIENRQFGWKTIGYLFLDKAPIPSRYLVWMSVELKNNNK